MAESLNKMSSQDIAHVTTAGADPNHARKQKPNWRLGCYLPSVGLVLLAVFVVFHVYFHSDLTLKPKTAEQGFGLIIGAVLVGMGGLLAFLVWALFDFIAYLRAHWNDP